jgi:hypothetical protein
MITTLNTTVIVPPTAPPVSAVVATIYPTLVVFSTNPKVIGCVLPPSIAAFNLVNDGNEGSTAFVNEWYFTSYQSQSESTDIIGNYSGNGTNWIPALNNTDPPSHLQFITKAFSFDCAFYPVINNYNNLFAIAWLESTPTGRLDLRYTDGITGNVMPSQPPAVPSETLTNFLYVYPRSVTVTEGEKTENIPLSDITIVDTSGAEFKIDLAQSIHGGLELSTQYPIRAFKWTQAFRQRHNTVIGTLTTIPTQANGFTNAPLSNIAMNIYYAHTGLLVTRLTTDEKGYYKFETNAYEYTFEIESANISINVNQRLL